MVHSCPGQMRSLQSQQPAVAGPTDLVVVVEASLTSGLQRSRCSVAGLERTSDRPAVPRGHLEWQNCVRRPQFAAAVVAR